MSTIEDQLGYSPNSAVVAAHNIPHLTTSLTLSTASNISTESRADYLISILVFPILITGICLVAVIIYHIFCCCCICTDRFNCVDHIDDEMYDIEEELQQKVGRKRRMTIRMYVILLALLVIFNNIIIVGDQPLADGIGKVGSVFDFLLPVTQDLVSRTDTVEALSNEINGFLSGANTYGCNATGSAESLVSSMVERTDSIHDMVVVFPDRMKETESVFDNFVASMEHNVMLTSYIVGWAVIGLFGIGLFLESVFFLATLVSLAGLLAFCLFIISGLLMIMLMAMGDFCMEPNTLLLERIDNVMGGMDQANSTYSALKYYFTCSGMNPLDSYADEALEYANALNFTLTEIAANASYTGDPAACFENVNVSAALDAMPAVYTQIDGMFQDLQCGPISVNLYNLVNSGFCDDSARGIFTMWIGIFAYAIILFFMNFTAGILYQYFDPLMWTLGSLNPPKNPRDDDIGIDNEGNQIVTYPVERLQLTGSPSYGALSSGQYEAEADIEMPRRPENSPSRRPAAAQRPARQ